jgi:ATP-dependent DNA helicase RecQ
MEENIWATTAPVTGDLAGRIHETVRRFWGFDTLRPLQEQAIRAGLERRDSLVVMPTGGGKSLCYQVPPVVADRLDVVVSPLISLMKDQVDGLVACGYPAAALHSNLDGAARAAVFDDLQSGRCRLLFVSPERLVSGEFQELLRNRGVRAFAIDEAHCISHWGHDFRREYRQLAMLKQRFPDVSVHAFTATATPRVQQDIVEQLDLADPNVLVGCFDRPNLAYRIVPRVDLDSQVLEVLHRHRDEAVIVYCITRKDTEQLAAMLKAHGVNAASYHAGMSSADRRSTQEAFAAERLDVIVATVAFGMGIDRSNVRCVIHAATPKSIEHYQQETGRAGRDGLEAECVLFYSAADVLKWKTLVERNATAEAGEELDGGTLAQLELLRHVQGLCSTLQCRHRALSRYFGQDYDRDNCEACDVCLGEVDPMADSTVVAQKILSCVARLDQRYGVGHVVQVLRGADTDNIRRWRHDTLTTFGLLRDVPEKSLTNLVYQLIDQGLLVRTPGDRPVIRLSDDSLGVLRGDREVLLQEPKAGKVRKAKAAVESWEGVDRGLYEHLRSLRRDLARERAVPAYVIFGDATLRELAKRRPTSLASFGTIRGVGEQKLADLGPSFVEAIAEYVTGQGLETDLPA